MQLDDLPPNLFPSLVFLLWHDPVVALYAYATRKLVGIYRDRADAEKKMREILAMPLHNYWNGTCQIETRELL